ncbi:hypothetical protein [Candidatus Vidania fulgoroideorum]
MKDFFYKKKFINKFINILMKSGKKNIAEKIFYKSMIYIRNFYKINPYNTFIECINKTKVFFELKNRKVGGVVFKIPSQMSKKRILFTSFKIIKESIKNYNKNTYISLGEEIYNTSLGESASVKKVNDLKKNTENNKAFIHLLN